MITPIRAFNDNYIWLLLNEDHKTAWVVDPGDATPVLDYCAAKQLDLAGILLTHHHGDHSGGIADLMQQWPTIPVYGSHLSRIQYITHPVREGDHLHCGSYDFSVLEIPGHTLDHVAFYNNKILFCGDTLFSAGCGRVFEGTYPQMYASLQKLAHLAANVEVYCGHEYTLQNLLFAHAVEPANQFIQQRIEVVKQQLAAGHASVPSLMQDEFKMNPFLRCDQLDVITQVQKHANQAVNEPNVIFQILREWKNNFK